MVSKDGEVGFIWFIAGLGLGMLLGVLYAPRPGSQTRQDIKDTVEEGREYVNCLGRDARDSVAELVERGKDSIHQRKLLLALAIEVGREAYREASGGNDYLHSSGGHQ